MYVEFLASHFNDLSRCISKFTGLAIVEELSIRRRLGTFLISRGQKMRVKHCYADLSSWCEFWFAIICIDMNVILDLSNTIQQFQRWFLLPVNGPSQRILFYWNTTAGNNSSTDESLLRKNGEKNVKNIFTLVCRSEIKHRGTLRSFLIAQSLTTHASTQPAAGAANIIDRMHTWKQCSVTISVDILTTQYVFNLRYISPLTIDNNTNTMARTKVACRTWVNRSALSPSWHTFEATHGGSLPCASATLRNMK